MTIDTSRESVERLLARAEAAEHDITRLTASLTSEVNARIAAEAEVARLSAPPDALALVAAAYRDAADQCQKERRNVSHLLSNPPQSDAARMIAIHIAERTPADAQASLTAIERAAYERGVRDALAEAVKEAKGSVTIGGQRFLTAKLDDLEPAFLALLTQEGR